MKTLSAIKLRVGLKPNGQADYPNFNVLQAVTDSGAGDWAYYLDSFGGGMHYDKTSGHREETADSPTGMQWAMLLVPADFAAQAVVKFPTVVTLLTAVECAAFYDTKVAANQPELLLDKEALAGIEASNALKADITDPVILSTLDRQKAEALDPDHVALGIRKNPHVTWSAMSAKRGITVV